MAKPCTGTTKAMGSHLLNGRFLGRVSHDPPDHLLADARTPNRTAVGDTAEDEAVINMSYRQPVIDGGLYPAGYRHRAHMTSFTVQVNNGPVIVSLLKVRQL